MERTEGVAGKLQLFPSVAQAIEMEDVPYDRIAPTAKYLEGLADLDRRHHGCGGDLRRHPGLEEGHLRSSA